MIVRSFPDLWTVSPDQRWQTTDSYLHSISLFSGHLSGIVRSRSHVWRFELFGLAADQCWHSSTYISIILFLGHLSSHVCIFGLWVQTRDDKQLTHISICLFSGHLSVIFHCHQKKILYCSYYFPNIQGIQERYEMHIGKDIGTGSYTVPKRDIIGSCFHCRKGGV